MEEAIIQRQNKETESIEPTFTQQPTAKHSGRRMSRWRPRARWLLVTLCIATVGGRLLAAESSMSAITQLTNYLASPRWLSELEVDLSLGHFYTKDQPKNRPEFSTWRASLQPEGYFFQCVSNSPYTSTLIFGESIDTYWQTSLAGVAVASKKKEEGGSEKNSRQAVSNVFKQNVRDILNLGIHWLDTSKIQITGSNGFIGHLLDWQGRPAKGTVRVTVESFDKGLPARMRCRTTEEPNIETLIICEYDRLSLPPSRVTIQKFEKETPILSMTNIIRHIAFGLRDDASKGFVPSTFVPPTLALKRFMIESNGIPYVQHPDGSRTVMVDSGPNPPEVRPSRYMFICWLAGLLVIGVTISLLVRKGIGPNQRIMP